MKSLLLYSHLRSRVVAGLSALLLVLSLVSSFFFKSRPSTPYQQKKLQAYLSQQQQDAAAQLQDTGLLRRLITGTEPEAALERLTNKPYGLFLYEEPVPGSTRILFWNTQQILPPDTDFGLPEGTYFQKLVNGYYLVNKTKLRLSNSHHQNITAYALIPVLFEYYLSTRHLQTQFPHDRKAVNTIALTTAETAYPITAAGSNRPLFYIREIAKAATAPADWLTTLLRIASLICFLIYLHLVAGFITKRSGSLAGLLFLIVSLALLRTLFFALPQAFSFSQTGLFDKSENAANWLNWSLGDLLINGLFLCWIILFAWSHIGPLKKIPSFLRGPRMYVAGLVALFFLIVSTFGLANVTRSLILDSKISFQVTDFFSLNYFSVIGFLALALACVCYYYFSRTLFRFIFPAFKDRYVYIYFYIALTGLLILTFRTGNVIVLFHLPVLLWLVIYTLLISQQQALINRFRITAAGMLFWIFFFSVSLAVLILDGNRESKRAIQEKIAQKYSSATDSSGERTINIAVTGIDNRFLCKNFERFKDKKEGQQLRDSIINANFASYTTQYETSIYLFDSLNRGINNKDPVSFPRLATTYLQSDTTNLADTRYHETAFDKFNYITRRIISDSNGRRGSFFIISSPRQYANSDALFPELLRQFSHADPEVSDAYVYGVYNNGILTVSSGKYPFKTLLSKGQASFTGSQMIRKSGYNEFWYKAGNNRIVIVARKTDSVIEIITLFSYLFCSFLFLAGLLQALSLLLRMISTRRPLSFVLNLNIRRQIHGTVIFISILSFLIIGAATIPFFIRRYKSNNIEKLSRTADIMVKELRKHNSETPDFFNNLSVDSGENSLQKLVEEVAVVHNADVNIYSPEGDLKVASQWEIYKKGILSNRMHPVAWHHLYWLKEAQWVQDEELSSLKYLSIYAAVTDNKGRPLAYLHVPYFSSQLDLKQEISNFLVTIIILNAFIFLMAGIIALFITNRITRSFSVIGNKMREITLGQHNEEIEWGRKDEIGELVEQYNRMVQQLEQSAEALAKSEREGAWREMARQVAHEIKNPLTPMKLSIQYLQKSIAGGQANIEQLTQSVAQTLIEQIDHLSKIASDFSQFANIGYKKVERIDLHAVISSLINLYSSNSTVNITWHKPEEKVIIQGDKSHMTRLFTNLLANAVEACSGASGCKIRIKEDRQADYVIISIHDNGEGIPEEMRSKIFTPNFTTKNSGTGLGLAMCKSIVESAGGRIWFESETGKGTGFFVLLPLENQVTDSP